MQFETIIGLEIHGQLKTKTKMFCGCANDGNSKPSNTTVCEVCLGHPGALPVPNRQALEWAIKAALALGCEINTWQKFDRKNYYYPDLPKGYQISQFALPIGENGKLKVKCDREIQIERLHLEEDAAKNAHFPDGTIGVDYNRGGTPLMEIVTRPDFRSPQEAKAFLQELKLVMRYLGVSDADMEKGHLRVDANISLRPFESNSNRTNENRIRESELENSNRHSINSKKISDKLYPKTEIKNLNSFKAVERALEYEVIRQTKLWEQGKEPQSQSTRGWDESSQATLLQRTKEESHDYRYFPEPDIPNLQFGTKKQKNKKTEKQSDISDIIDINKIKAQLPEMPAAKRQRFIEEYGVKPSDASTLISDIDLANYFEQAISEVKEWGSSQGIEDGAKLIRLTVNWLINKLGALISPHLEGGDKGGWSDIKITPENFAELITMLAGSKINSKVGQDVLAKMLESGGDPSSIVEAAGLEQMGDEEELLEIVKGVLESNPDEVKSYQSGKETLLQFLVGQVMKESHGKADPALAAKILKKELKK